MHSYSVTLGARNTPAAGRRFLPSDDALIQRITREHFPGGFTILEAKGGWWDPQKSQFIKEHSRQVSVASASVKKVRRWARALGIALAQKELLVCSTGRVRRVRISRRSIG